MKSITEDNMKISIIVFLAPIVGIIAGMFGGRVYKNNKTKK